MFFPVAKLGLKLKLFVKNLYSSAQTHIAMKKNSAAPCQWLWPILQSIWNKSTTSHCLSSHPWPPWWPRFVNFHVYHTGSLHRDMKQTCAYLFIKVSLALEIHLHFLILQNLQTRTNVTNLCTLIWHTGNQSERNKEWNGEHGRG